MEVDINAQMWSKSYRNIKVTHNALKTVHFKEEYM